MVVGDGDVPACSHADPDGKVGDAFAADLPQVVALVVEHLDTVGSVVADEHLLLVVHGNAIGELEISADSCVIMCVKEAIKVNYHLEQENLTRTLPCMSKMTTLITLHSTTTILPQGSTATPLGCCRTSAPNFLRNWPYLLNI